MLQVRRIKRLELEDEFGPGWVAEVDTLELETVKEESVCRGAMASFESSMAGGGGEVGQVERNLEASALL